MEAGRAGPGRTLCKAAPRPIHLVGAVQASDGAVSAGPSTAQQPNSQPFDFPLMSLEELLCPALRNVCPSQSASPLGSSRAHQPSSPENRRYGGGGGGRAVIRAHPRSQRAAEEAFCPAGAVQTLALNGHCSVSGGSPVSLASVGTSVGPGGRRGQSTVSASPQGRGQG